MGLLSRILPTTYDLWAIDFNNPQNHFTRSDLLFLVAGDDVEFLSNRTGKTVRLAGRRLYRIDHEKMHIEAPSGRRVLVKHWLVAKEPEGGGVNDDLRKLPKGMLDPLPPEKRSATQIEHRLAELGF